MLTLQIFSYSDFVKKYKKTKKTLKTERYFLLQMNKSFLYTLKEKNSF